MSRFALIGMLVAVTLQAFSAKGALPIPGTISKFDLQVCRPDQQVCYRVMAPQAQGSQLKELFSFSSAKVEVINRQTGHTLEIRRDRGYVDLELNRLVIWNTDLKHRQEMVFDY